MNTLEADEYAALLQMGSVDLDWNDPFTYPEESEKPKDNPQFKNFPPWPYGHKGSKESNRCTHKGNKDEFIRSKSTSLGKRPADKLWQTQRNTVQRDSAGLPGVRPLGSDANPKVRDRALSVGAIRRISIVQGRQERTPEIQPDLAPASSGPLGVDRQSKTRQYSYSTSENKWVESE